MKRLSIISAMLVLLALLLPSATLAQTPPECESEYTVQKDDWLSKIADKYYDDMFAYNLIVSTADDGSVDDVRSGQGTLRQFIKNAEAIEVTRQIDTLADEDGLGTSLNLFFDETAEANLQSARQATGASTANIDAAQAQVVSAEANLLRAEQDAVAAFDQYAARYRDHVATNRVSCGRDKIGLFLNPLEERPRTDAQ